MSDDEGAATALIRWNYLDDDGKVEFETVETTAENGAETTEAAIGGKGLRPAFYLSLTRGTDEKLVMEYFCTRADREVVGFSIMDGGVLAVRFNGEIKRLFGPGAWQELSVMGTVAED